MDGDETIQSPVLNLQYSFPCQCINYIQGVVCAPNINNTVGYSR